MGTDRIGVVRRERREDTEVVTLEMGALRAEVLTYGAHLVGLWVPDRDGRCDDVVVSLRDVEGRPDIAAYRDPLRNPHLGGMAGRYANRIRDARFELDGALHQLVANEGAHQLHGGPEGFDRREWTVLDTHEWDRAAVTLGLSSHAGDQGFPGAVDVQVTYALETDGVLRIECEGHTDAPTVLNVTNHTYWNLAGARVCSEQGGEAAAATLAEHRLRVAADRVVVVDGALLPTGELAPVDRGPFDLRERSRLGDVLADPRVAHVGGLDHCLVFAPRPPEATAIELLHPPSGRRLRIRTDQPGVQVYTANHGAGPWPEHAAVCLETQHLPDAPNQPGFPSPVLQPGETYRHLHLIDLDTVD
jgi:aldose 1-epimerase